jgi:transposase
VAAGLISLWFLDQSGFAPTLPTGHSWGRLGQRLVVPYQAPQRRRVNAVGAVAPYDPAGPQLVYETRRSTASRYDATAHLAFVEQVATAADAERPCMVVLDNYAVHHAREVKAATDALAERGITFWYLPHYSPELNPIEAGWKQVTYYEMPVRSYATEAALQQAVDAALERRRITLDKSTHNLP